MENLEPVQVVKKGLDVKDIIILILIVAVIAVGVNWYLSSRQVSQLREDKLLLSQELLVEQETKTKETEEAAKETDRKIGTIKERQRKNTENEQTLINNPSNLDVRAAEEFFAKYEPVTGN